MMGFLVFMVVGVFILAAIQLLWPMLLAAAGIALGFLALRAISNSLSSMIDAHRATVTSVIKRADEQHSLILSGDEIGGTYGNYLPPPDLR